MRRKRRDIISFLTCVATGPRSPLHSPQHPALCLPTDTPYPSPSMPSMYAPPPPLQWVSLFDNINREWMEAVQMVLDYFCERTPR